MKKLIMICCMLAATVTFSNAQQVAPPLDVATPVSKADFVQKVTVLNKLIEDNMLTAADKQFSEVDKMIQDELKVARYIMRDAKTDAEKAQALDVIKNQRRLYSAIMQTSRDKANSRKVLIEKLNEFAETI